MIELLIGCLIFSGVVMTTARAIGDAITTAKAAKAGEWDFLDKDRDRRANRWSKAWEATRRRRHKEAGGSGAYQPGLGAYLGDVYHGWCQDLIDRRRSKREQRGPAVYDPDRKPWHERVDDAAFALGRRLRERWLRRGNKPAPAPAPEPDPSPPDEEQPGEEAEPAGTRRSAAGAGWAAFKSDLAEELRIKQERWRAAGPDDPGERSHPQNQSTTTEGDDMNTTTDASSTATGDAHDVESALQQCDLLDDDLTRIDTSLDVIDEAIASAGSAAELIEAFLASKNVGDAVTGMSVARDMLSPTHIKALIDAIAAAKSGVAQAREELLRLQDVEQQLNGADGSVLNGR
jgi:hypothetical protein